MGLTGEVRTPIRCELDVPSERLPLYLNAILCCKGVDKALQQTSSISERERMLAHL